MNLSHILVVDDEENIRLGLRLLLQGEGYSVRTAAHGLEALAALQEFASDLVLTDLHMPQMNGLDFLEVVRRDFPHVHVIMMSALGGVKSCTDAGDFGACGYLNKPVTLEALRSVLDRLPVNLPGELPK